MANPFYLPPEPQRQDNTFAQILAGLKLGLDAYSTYQTGAIADRREALSQKELEMKGAQFDVNKELEREKIGLMRSGQTIDQAKVDEMRTANRLKAGADPSLKNFGAVSGTMASNHLQKLGLKKNSPILQGIQEMVKNPDVNNGEAYRMLLQNYPVMREELINSFAESYASKLDKTQGTHADTPEGKEQIAAIEALESDETGEKFLSRYFPGTQEAIKQKEAIASKAAAPAQLSLDQIKGQIGQAVLTGRLSPEEGQKIMNLIDPQKPGDKFKSVGGSLIDISGETPKSVFTAPPDDMTGELREYRFAQSQGEKRSFTDWKASMKKAGATTVTMNAGTKTQLEKDIVEQTAAVDTLDTIKKLTKPEYLEYSGRLKSGAAKIGEKFGAQIVDEKWLADRQAWYQTAKQNQIAFRKWATGVAGGQRELEEIAKAYPDPDKNSPTEFMANLDQATITAKRLIKRYNMFLGSGIIPTKEQLSSIPLESITISSPGTGSGLSDEAANFLKKRR